MTREQIEWCNFRWHDAPDTSRPRVLLIGDSIANSYHATVVAELAGLANVDLLATSAGIDDPALERQLRFAVAEYRHVAIHVNNGLHGWHVTDADYRDGLRAMLGVLQAVEPAARLIWGATTGVTVRDQNAIPCPEKSPVVDRRNAIARAVMAEAHIPVNDLHAVVAGHPDYRAGDGYHFGPAGQQALGKAVAACLRPCLSGLR